MAAPGGSSWPYDCRHGKQKVCMQGRHLGFLKVSVQMEHSVRFAILELDFRDSRGQDILILAPICTQSELIMFFTLFCDLMEIVVSARTFIAYKTNKLDY